MITPVGFRKAIKVAKDTVDLHDLIDKTIYVTRFAGSLAEDGYRILRDRHIPLFDSPTKCVRAAKAPVQHKRSLSLVRT